MAVDSGPSHARSQAPAAGAPGSGAAAAQAEGDVDPRGVLAQMHKECRSLDLVRRLCLHWSHWACSHYFVRQQAARAPACCLRLFCMPSVHALPKVSALPWR